MGLSAAYGGGRFEFRAVGSSQNVSMVNTVLNTITAESMAVIADQIEGGASAQDAASATLEAHWRCIFNGDNYSDEWLEEAAARGVWYQNPPPTHTHILYTKVFMPRCSTGIACFNPTLSAQ